jgi:hypothetical protein
VIKRVVAIEPQWFSLMSKDGTCKANVETTCGSRIIVYEINVLLGLMFLTVTSS